MTAPKYADTRATGGDPGSPAEPIRVLHVDDRSAFADLTAESLERERSDLAVETETDPRTALERVVGGDVDCVLSDYEMPGLDGLELLSELRDRGCDVPFILFTGNGSESIASRAISAGVTDYVRKAAGTDQYAVLSNRIAEAVSQYRAEAALERNERQFRELVGSAPAPVVLYDGDGTIVYANRACADFLGVEDPAALVGRDALDFVHPDDHDEVTDRLATLEDAESPPTTELTYVTEGGDTKRAVVACAPASHDERAVGQTILRDLTDAADRNYRLRALIDNLPGVVYRCSNEPDWPMTTLEGDCESLTGYSSERILTGDLTWGGDVIHPEDRERTWEIVQEAIAAADPFEVTYRIVDADGRTRWVWERGRAVEVGPRDVAIEGFITDITDRKRRERQLERQSERFDAFASVLSHDLKNPLAAVRGRIEIARETEEFNHLDRALATVDRLDGLIDDLSAVMRDGNIVGDPEEVALDDAARSAWEATVAATASENAELTVDGATIEADADALIRLLENLFRNSVEHGSTGSRSEARGNSVEHGSTDSRTPSGGRVDPEPTDQRARTGANADGASDPGEPDDGATDDAPGVRVRVVALGDGFAVEDDGPGIPADEREAVFEPNYTTTDDGPGVGLTSVRQIARGHGWTVGITEGCDGGTRIEFSDVERIE